MRRPDLGSVVARAASRIASPFSLLEMTSALNDIDVAVDIGSLYAVAKVSGKVRTKPWGASKKYWQI